MAEWAEIALTGASSFIGRHFVKYLSLCDDFVVRAMVHNSQGAFPVASGKIITMRGDLRAIDTIRDLVSPGSVVVNLAYLGGAPPEQNIAAVENLLEVCGAAGIRRLIHCSTAVVAGRVKEDVITERTVLNPLNEYERTKSRLEQIVFDRSKGRFESVILRPTAVFGEGGKNLIKMADDIRQGSRIVNYLKSCLYQRRRMNLVFIDTVVAALAFLVKAPVNLDGEVFIVSDDEIPSNNYRDIETYFMRAMGYKDYSVSPVPLPLMLPHLLLRIMGRTNVNPVCVYDCGKILSAGLKKPLSFEEGLSRFAEWYMKDHHDSGRSLH